MARWRRNKEQILSDIASQSKECCVCNTRKKFDEFYNYANKSDGKSYRCKNCDEAASKKYRATRAEQYKRKARNQSLKIKFGITTEQYNEILEKQEGKCKICLTSNPLGEGNSSSLPYSFPVDHCHKTGKIRGLLCNTCNRALGFLKDDVNILKRAIMYLDGDL